MPRLISLAVLLLMISILGVTFFKVVAPFLLPLFLAAMTAIICQPLYRYFLMRCRNHLGAAAALTTFTLMAAIMIPLMTGVMLASLQLYKFSASLGDDKEVRQKTKEFVKRSVEFGNGFLPASLQADPDLIYQELKTSLELELSKIGNRSLGRGDIEVTPLPINEETAEEASSHEGEKSELMENVTVESEQASLAALGETTPPEVVTPPAAAATTPPPATGVTTPSTTSPPASATNAANATNTADASGGSSSISIGRAAAGAAGTTLSVLTGTAGLLVRFLIGLMMYAVALFYFLADGTMLLRAAETLIPVHADYQRQLFTEFSKAVRSVVMATFFAAIAQGVCTTLALWFFGFEHIFVLFVLATLGAMIPLAGTWLVWLPCAIYLFAHGHAIQAGILALYGTLFVGFLDNVIRTYVLNSNVKLHPLLAFISVLGGIQTMGLWGVFIGPIVASCLHALVKIFNLELIQLSRERQTRSLEGAVGEPLPVPQIAPVTGVIPAAAAPAATPPGK
ncbi:AI-2E family transporter [Planctomicrobium sp. SH664]|uniref:AI-2E family transporter n=1 Tax=Planctomicrobium sp. SH664 TaxID=3448125 RepID=UPI003F5B2365